MNGYIIALDQGTTSSRSIVFDQAGNIVSLAQYPFAQIYPKPGWVEHDPMVILQTQMHALGQAFEKSELSPTDIAGIGITNQRETTIVWDKNTGKPVYNAIVWQCRRTAPICDQLEAEGVGAYIRDKTGLLIDAYFSGTKIKWILDNVEGARERAERGELLFGTVDSWLIWNLTGGKAHVSDYSNCARTMLFDIDALCWDEKLCSMLGIPMSMLPKPVPPLRSTAASLRTFRDLRCSRASPCAAAPATRLQRFWVRRASSPVRRRTPTAPAASR